MTWGHPRESLRRPLGSARTAAVVDQLREGDILVVWKLDRLSRSLRDVLTIVERLGEAKAGFRSLTEAIDTTSAAGRMMMQMVGAFAEFERACYANVPAPAWSQPARKVESEEDVREAAGRDRSHGPEGRQKHSRRRSPVQHPPSHSVPTHR